MEGEEVGVVGDVDGDLFFFVFCFFGQGGWGEKGNGGEDGGKRGRAGRRRKRVREDGGEEETMEEPEGGLAAIKGGKTSIVKVFRSVCLGLSLSLSLSTPPRHARTCSAVSE